MKDYKALLTIYGLQKMSKKEIRELKIWLRKLATEIDKEEYANVTRFRLMK